MSHLTLSEENLISFTRELQVLIKAGVSLVRSLELIKLQSKDVKMKNILSSMISDLSEGKSLAGALERYEKIFSPFYISVISVGENRGKLDESLQRIYNYLNTIRELKQKLISAVTYPALLIVSGIGVLMAMIILVLPKFVDMFSRSGVDLPKPTQILVMINTLFTKHGLFLLFFVLFIAIILAAMNATKKGKYRLHYWQLKSPLIGEFLLIISVTKFSRTMGVLYESGVQLLQAIDLCKLAIQNLVMKEEVDKIKRSLMDGKGMSDPMMNSKIFPPMMAQMVAIGEETGSLDNMLQHVANYYEQETIYRIKRMITMLEPIALILIAVIVAFIAAAVLLPLFKMAGSIRGM